MAELRTLTHTRCWGGGRGYFTSMSDSLAHDGRAVQFGIVLEPGLAQMTRVLAFNARN
jgi:hypothetical protein